MTVTLKFEDGAEQVIKNVTYFAWNGHLFECEKLPNMTTEKLPYPWSPVRSTFPADVYPASKIVQVSITVANATFRAETENYSVHRDVKEIGFDINKKRFLGNLSYAGRVMSFSANENM